MITIIEMPQHDLGSLGFNLVVSLQDDLIDEVLHQQERRGLSGPVASILAGLFEGMLHSGPLFAKRFAPDEQASPLTLERFLGALQQGGLPIAFSSSRSDGLMQDVKSVLGLADEFLGGRKFGAAIRLGQLAELASLQHV